MSSRMVLLSAAVGIAAGMLCGCGAHESGQSDGGEAAEVAPAAVDAAEKTAPIEEFAQALTDLGAPPAVAEAPEEGARAKDEETSREDVAALAEEIQGLRVEVAKLEETLEVYLDVVVGDLKDENARLRQEIVRLYTRGLAEAGGAVPRPGRLFIDQILQETPYDENLPDAAFLARLDGPIDGAAKALEDDAFNGEAFAVVKEWGRGPEEVAALGKDISTLRGMICAVPEGIPEEQLIGLARSLRAECDGYDNINIEIFEGMDAAERYAKTNRADPERRLLSVSKHTASGRDVILLMTQGMTREVAVEMPLAERD